MRMWDDDDDDGDLAAAAEEVQARVERRRLERARAQAYESGRSASQRRAERAFWTVMAVGGLGLMLAVLLLLGHGVCR